MKKMIAVCLSLIFCVFAVTSTPVYARSHEGYKMKMEQLNTMHDKINMMMKQSHKKMSADDMKSQMKSMNQMMDQLVDMKMMMRKKMAKMKSKMMMMNHMMMKLKMMMKQTNMKMHNMKSSR